MSRFANFMKFMSNNRPSDTIIGAMFQTTIIGYAMIQANDNQKNSTDLQKKIHDESTNLQRQIHDDNANLQMKIHDDNANLQMKIHNYNRARFIIDSFNELRSDLRNKLYGSEHRNVSDGIAQILSKYDQEEFRNSSKIIDKDELSLSERRGVAEKWYKKYLDFAKENNSMDQKRKHSEYQVNMYRSEARDSFINIHGILETYVELTNTEEDVVNEQGFKLGRILSVGQAKEFLQRYYRFVRYVKPIDEKMGYTNNDGEIYKHDEFKDLLKKCFKESNLQEELEITYKNLGFELLK